MNREQWDKEHKVCPKCNSNNISQTLVGIVEVAGEYHDNKNSALCKGCGWAGKVAELIPELKNAPDAPIQTPKMELKTIDSNGESYVCIKDMAAALVSFNENICDQLEDKGTQQYTSKLMMEITSMLATVDMQHWTNKHEMKAKQDELDTKTEEKTEE